MTNNSIYNLYYKEHDTGVDAKRLSYVDFVMIMTYIKGVILSAFYNGEDNNLSISNNLYNVEDSIKALTVGASYSLVHTYHLDGVEYQFTHKIERVL